MSPLKMRALAQCLFTYEAMSAKSSESTEYATLRIYEKLRQSLSAFAGAAAFESLAFRALTQAKSEAPSLWMLQIAADGSLQSVGGAESEIDIDKDLAGDFPTGDGGIILIARLLGLLVMFLGESITLSLLRAKWPEAGLDDCGSKNGRKA